MSTSISDPFLLSSYTLPDRLAYASSSKDTSDGSLHALIDDQYISSSDQGGGFVSVGVQGDGVHVLDLSTLHAAVSHTLGPNTTFACPPASRKRRVGGIQTCTTYAVISSSLDIREEERGRTVWWWEEALSGGVMTGGATRRHSAAVMPLRITHIYAPDDLPNGLVLVSPTGQLIVTDADLNIQTAPLEDQDDGVLVKHLLFPRKAVAFVPEDITSSGTVVAAAILSQDKGWSVSLSVVDTSGQVHVMGTCSVPLDEPELVITDISFSPAGYVSILTRSGRWFSYRLSFSSVLTASPLAPPIHLTSLSFLTGPHAEGHPHEISLLALTSSHVLLAGIPAIGDPQILFLLWDIQYGILLAEQRCAIPSTLHRRRERGIWMSLKFLGSVEEPSQALLTLHPALNGEPQGSRVTTILVVPLNVPRTSTIASALGRAAAGQQWILRERREDTIEGRFLTLDAAGLEVDQVKTLKLMLLAQEDGQLREVEERWTRYINNEAIVIARHRGRYREPPIGHLFVKQVMDLLFLVPSKSGKEGRQAGDVYARSVVGYLLEKRAVSNAMVEGGLLPALQMRNDWQNINLAMSTNTDLPELDIVSALAAVISHHQRTTSTDTDIMTVDLGPSAPPTLPVFLGLVVTYPTSPGALRVALRKHLSGPQEIQNILEILDGWVERWAEHEVRLLPERVKKDAHGVPVPIFAEDQKADLPPLEKILGFTQAVLDTSFLALLSHLPAHKLLRKLLVCLQSELALVSELQALQGPLQPFAAAHARAVYEGAHGVPQPDLQTDWRQRKKAQREKTEMNIGVYQVEELII